MMRRSLIAVLAFIALRAAPLPAEVLVASRGDLERALKEIEASFPVVSGAVVSVVDAMAYTDLSSAAGVRAGSELSVYREGNEILHPLTGQVLGRFEIPLGTIHLTLVAPGYAAGEVSGTGEQIRPGDRVRTTAVPLRVALLVPPDGSGAPSAREGWPVELAAAMERTSRFLPVVTGAPVPGRLPETPGERAGLARSQGADLFLWPVPEGAAGAPKVRLECYSGATGRLITAAVLPLGFRGDPLFPETSPAVSPAGKTPAVAPAAGPDSDAGERAMTVRFVFCIHNHQPVGNFGFVMENAYRESYVPFLDVFSRHPSLKLVLHYSGILYQWMEEHHPDYLARLAAQAAGGRIEFLAGGFYEPILAVIPEADRIGQLRRMRDYLKQRFGQEAGGLWLAERVWEPDLPGSIVAAGLRYVVVDDYHLRAAGITDGEITAPCLTSDQDRVITVIGGSEQLRYLIPYEEPEATVSFLRSLHEQNPGGELLVTMADDGEKFGVWPGTHKRVFQEGWLERFFSLLEAERDWLEVTTFAEALSRVAPERQVYLPTTSYMEMSEWTLPPRAAETYLALKEIIASREDLGYARQFLRGGYWRNFLSKYPESRYLLGRMLAVSRRAHLLEEHAAGPGSALRPAADEALDELWQGQCNDAYWHGVFGGLYLPFLRAALYEHLIRAETVIEGTQGEGPFVSLEAADLDGDGREEYLLRNRLLTLVVDPASGAALELDVKPVALNLFNSLSRREEGYHRRLVRLREAAVGEGVRSIHDMERMKDGGKVPGLSYDDYPRCSLVDHRWRGAWTWDDWRRGRRAEAWPGKRGYRSADWREEPGGLTLTLSAPERPGEYPASEKRVTLDRAAALLRVELAFARGGTWPSCKVGQEFNLTPTSILECHLELLDREGKWHPVGPGGGAFPLVRALRVRDDHRALTLLMEGRGPLNLWLCPLATVSNSEAGYEEIPQQWSVLWWRETVPGVEGADLDLVLSVHFTGEGGPAPRS